MIFNFDWKCRCHPLWGIKRSYSANHPSKTCNKNNFSISIEIFLNEKFLFNKFHNILYFRNMSEDWIISMLVIVNVKQRSVKQFHVLCSFSYMFKLWKNKARILSEKIRTMLIGQWIVRVQPIHGSYYFFCTVHTTIRKQ